MTLLLLGRPDVPTDGVADYSERLAAALQARGRDTRVARMHWERDGWTRAFADLRRDERAGRGRWVVLQYTALQWSRRGFPWRVPSLIRDLARMGCRVAVTLHDPDVFPHREGVGPIRYLVDAARRFVQRRAMRFIADRADLVVHTTASETVAWGVPNGNAWVIPVGSNVDAPVVPSSPSVRRVISVFGVSGEPRLGVEMKQMADVIRVAVRAAGPVRVELCGRNSEQAGTLLLKLVDGTGVEIEAHGIVSAAHAGRIIAGSSVAILLRGQATSGRGSLSAAIACGVPAVAWKGSRSGRPLTDAGVVLVENGDIEAFGAAVAEILGDRMHATELQAKQAEAQRVAFGWEAIAARYDAVLLDG